MKGHKPFFVRVLAQSTTYSVFALMLACKSIGYWALDTSPKKRVEVFVERLVFPSALLGLGFVQVLINSLTDIMARSSL